MSKKNLPSHTAKRLRRWFLSRTVSSTSFSMTVPLWSKHHKKFVKYIHILSHITIEKCGNQNKEEKCNGLSYGQHETNREVS